MSYIRVYIHAVFGTRCRSQMLEENKRETLFSHIRSNAKEKNILIDSINGYDDHVHLLLKMNAVQSLAGIMHLVKGESSWWANETKIFEQKLIWARGYFAASVNGKDLSKVRQYIANQQEHHKTISFEEECKLLVKQ